MKVCVYCASSAEIDSIYLEAAAQLGRLLAENNITCINGAGKQGLMGALNNSMLRHGGTAIGIIPQFMVEADWFHPDLTEIIVTETMHERKTLMAHNSNAIIALPGGMGTLEELTEIITWRQLGLYKNPIIVLNINEYYNPLLAFFEKMIDEKFMPDTHRNTWQVVDTAEEAVRLLNKIQRFKGSKVQRFKGSKVQRFKSSRVSDFELLNP
jgi:uncharacterized protein (TIGR00730 family)